MRFGRSLSFSGCYCAHGWYRCVSLTRSHMMTHLHFSFRLVRSCTRICRAKLATSLVLLVSEYDKSNSTATGVDIHTFPPRHDVLYAEGDEGVALLCTPTCSTLRLFLRARARVSPHAERSSQGTDIVAYVSHSHTLTRATTVCCALRFFAPGLRAVTSAPSGPLPRFPETAPRRTVAEDAFAPPACPSTPALLSVWY